MIRLAVVVEGETEEEFVKSVIVSHLRQYNIETTPILPGNQGGDISVKRLAKSIE